LEVVPARILCYGCDLLPPLKAIPELLFADLPVDEQLACEQIERTLSDQPQLPTFLVIGSVLGEATRRRLRLISIERPLFFIEANDAPNHLSLAREAKLVQRVIRLLTPAIFSPRFHTLSTVFIAGNADFLSVIENVHFNLKGTPSASEIEFLSFLLDQQVASPAHDSPSVIPQSRLSFEGLALGGAAEIALPRLAEQASQHLEALLDDHTHLLEHSLRALEEKVALFARRVENTWKNPIFDEFAALEVRELIDLLIENLHRPETFQALQRSFLSAFVKHQPQYQPEACLVAKS
jgi:hypothetical protein